MDDYQKREGREKISRCINPFQKDEDDYEDEENEENSEDGLDIDQSSGRKILQKKFQCEQCGKMLASYGSWWNHTRTAHLGKGKKSSRKGII